MQSSSPAIPPTVAGFITSARVGRLATADAGGQPMVVPICYAFDGRALYSAVDAKPKQAPPEGLKRIRNLRENPRVSIVIDEYEEDWTRLRYVIIQGRAELLTEGAHFTHGVDLLLAKYAQYERIGLPRERGLMIRVTPSRVSAWQYSS
ncbi:MAG TPA: TIGR03668 family PPOX class F420-dependent oxidoreductase [Methylomirabilota bacterium]|nr:TIGR03668 family PPOX class F420-dependent oxidoreductase [Methylomirabilota bacterium]